jgi:hypothetical protein
MTEVPDPNSDNPEKNKYYPFDSPRTNREFLEDSGQRIHLFVDGMEGPRQLYDRRKASARALARLIDLAKPKKKK